NLARRWRSASPLRTRRRAQRHRQLMELPQKMLDPRCAACGSAESALHVPRQVGVVARKERSWRADSNRGPSRGAAFPPFATNCGILRSPSDTRTDTTILTAALGRDNGAISLLASRSDGSRTLDRSGARAIRTDRGYGIGLSGNAGLQIFLLAIG